MAAFPVYELTVYDSDDATALFAVGSDPSHTKPYLKVPTDFAQQEVDFVKSSASIGQVTCQVVDKRTIATDQSTGYITGLLADPSGYSQLNGHRAVLTEDLGAGAAKIMDGVVRGVTLMDTFVGFEFELRDIRERERKTRAFTTTDTPTVLPRGVLNGYGVDVPILATTTRYPVRPTQPLKATYVAYGSEGLVDFVNIGTNPEAELRLTGPMRDALEHVDPLDDDPSTLVYGWFKVLWRDTAAGGAYTEITQLLKTSRPSYITTGNPSVPAVYGLYINAGVSSASLPSNGQAIDVIVQYDGPVTDDWPLHLQGITVGELLRNLYRGDYSDEDPRIRVDETALLALTTPVRAVIKEPVDDLRDWAEKNAYPIELAAPTLDDDGRISPRTAALPDASATPVNLGDSNCRPAGGGWSHPSQDAVNLVLVIYKREYGITNDGSLALSDTIREREHTEKHLIAESVALLGEQKLEIKSVLLRAIGGKDGGPIFGDVQDELGAQVAERITRVATDRFALGGQYFAVDGARSDADVEALRPGDWVIIGHSWIPDYVAGTRGASRLAQVVSRRNIDAAWCALVLQDAGSDNAPVTQPTLGTVTVDSSGVVSVPVSAIGTGDEARVDYAVNATEPAASSSLWTYAGRTASPATIKTQAFAPGSTIWVRARGEGIGQRPSAYTTAVSVSVGTVPRVLSATTSIDDATGIPTVSWVPNGYALGVRLYYEAHDPNTAPTFASSVDVDASDLEHEFSALSVSTGQAFSVKLEPYTGWTGSAVSGTAGPDVQTSAILRGDAAYALAVQAITDAAGAQATADGKVVVFYQGTTPTAEGVGDLWIDTANGKVLKRWDGATWTEEQDADIAQAILDAANAQSTADSKIVTFYTSSTPTATSVGDFWVDTGHHNRILRWDGSSWVAVSGSVAAGSEAVIGAINGDFEQGLAYWGKANGAGTLEAQSSIVDTGTYALHFNQATAAQLFVYQCRDPRDVEHTVADADRHYMSCRNAGRIRVRTRYRTDGSSECYIQVHFYDAGKSSLSAFSKFLAATAAWSDGEYIVRVPSTAYYVTVGFVGPSGTTGDCYFDNYQVTAIETTKPAISVREERSSGTSTVTIDVDDPALAVTAIEYKKRDAVEGGDTLDATWQTAWTSSSGTIGTNTTLQRVIDIPSDPGLDGELQWRVQYTGADGSAYAAQDSFKVVNLEDATKTIRIDSSAFRLNDPTLGGAFWFAQSVGGTSTTGATLFAPVPIPVGVTITQVRFRCALTYSGDSIDVWFYRCPEDLSLGVTTLGSDSILGSTDGTGNHWVTLSMSEDVTSTAIYKASVLLDLDAGETGTGPKLGFVEVEYAVPSYVYTY